MKNDGGHILKVKCILLNCGVLVFVALFAATPNLTSAETKDTAPVIFDLIIDPAAGPTGTPYTLTLHITHPQGPDNIVHILYQMREGLEAIEVLINDEGLDGDLKKGDGIYSGQSRVPDTASKQSHRFEVFIRDKEGHKSNVLAYRFTVQDGVMVEII
ncbi:hypothetical protein JYT87_02365 [Nitrospira defluvii]|nr:hypothetical protein [Nitrospira defluvii]